MKEKKILNIRAYTFILILAAFLFSLSSCDHSGESDPTGIELDLDVSTVKTLIVEMTSDELTMLQEAGLKLNIAIKVNNTFDVVWQSISEYENINTYQWSQKFQVFASNEFQENVTVEIQTNLVNVELGQEVILDPAGVLSPAMDGGPADSINFINDFGLIHPGLSQQLTDPTGVQEILPAYISTNPIVVGIDELTPMDEVMVWFEVTETGTMFSGPRPNPFVADLTEINELTVLFSNREWSMPPP